MSRRRSGAGWRRRGRGLRGRAGTWRAAARPTWRCSAPRASGSASRARDPCRAPSARAPSQPRARTRPDRPPMYRLCHLPPTVPPAACSPGRRRGAVPSRATTRYLRPSPTLGPPPPGPSLTCPRTSLPRAGAALRHHQAHRQGPPRKESHCQSQRCGPLQSQLSFLPTMPAGMGGASRRGEEVPCGGEWRGQVAGRGGSRRQGGEGPGSKAGPGDGAPVGRGPAH